MTGARLRQNLRRALTRGFELIQQDTDGPVSAMEDVETAYATIERAWEACPEAREVYAQAIADWRTTTGRDPLTGRPLGAAAHARHD